MSAAEELANLSRERVSLLSQLIYKCTSEGKEFRLYPPDEVCQDPQVLKADEIIEKLDGTTWVIRYRDGTEEELSLAETLSFLHELRSVLQQIDTADPAAGDLRVKIDFAQPGIVTADNARQLLASVTLELR